MNGFYHLKNIKMFLLGNKNSQPFELEIFNSDLMSPYKYMRPKHNNTQLGVLLDCYGGRSTRCFTFSVNYSACTLMNISKKLNVVSVAKPNLINCRYDIPSGVILVAMSLQGNDVERLIRVIQIQAMGCGSAVSK
jgi:hypothetical protein